MKNSLMVLFLSGTSEEENMKEYGQPFTIQEGEKTKRIIERYILWYNNQHGGHNLLYSLSKQSI